jgi:LmbE family N-acetylglucosaminyl deacetylase
MVPKPPSHADRVSHPFSLVLKRGMRLLSAFAVATIVSVSPTSLAAQTKDNPDKPLPQDIGAAGLKEQLRKLSTTARLLHTTAHPDDEDGGMMTMQARGLGVNTTLLTLTRGEGGQNKVGSNLFDVLGVLRTLELLASDRYYGVQQRFTRVADFGFSKRADETFEKWQGHDNALADMVRVIRTFRPDVIASRFQGSERDGHGNHQAAGILTREAFRAAADPNRFPDQIAEGLLPWQAKKFYTDGFGSSSDYSVKLDTGTPDALLGMSYIQFALQGLRHQLSQGAAGWSVDPGPHYTYYKLIDSALPHTADKEQSFFDGIDTTLPGLASRLGSEESKVPFVRDALVDVQKRIKQATDDSDKDSSRAAGPLLSALNSLEDLIGLVDHSGLSPSAKLDLLTSLRDKRDQCETAVRLAMNVSLEATVAPPKGAGTEIPTESQSLAALSPGQKAVVVAKFHNGSKFLLQIKEVALEPSNEWKVDAYRSDIRLLKPGEDYYANFRIEPLPSTPVTRPYWSRHDPETESINRIWSEDERYATLPAAPPALRVRLEYSLPDKGPALNLQGWSIGGKGIPGHAEISSTVTVPFKDESGVERGRPLAVVPAFSVMLEPVSQVIPADAPDGTSVTVGVTANTSGVSTGSLRLSVPEGWKAEPAETPVRFTHRGETSNFEFHISPTSLKEGKLELKAVLDSSGTKYAEGYSLVTREDLGGFYYYQPAVQRLSIVSVKVPRDLKIGYIMGAGDDIPTVLKQLGMNVTLIPADALTKTDLGQFGTVVLGIRTYDTQKEVTANNRRLLDFVSAGGTLIVQYNTGVGDFNGGHFTPYSAQLSRARVSVEDAPVAVLAPEDGIFHFPNQITQKDFDNWVQERGLYFMDQWDSHFTPLLASNDPGEQPQKGGLLRAQFGKGTYIYTGYAFFRQLPAGVPGAIRLYVNLLAAGHANQ